MSGLGVVATRKDIVLALWAIFRLWFMAAAQRFYTRTVFHHQGAARDSSVAILTCLVVAIWRASRLNACGPRQSPRAARVVDGEGCGHIGMECRLFVA
jgi:hypothetical protein